MRFRVLGTVEVSSDGRSLPITAEKQLTLLALLLVRPGHVMSADRLIREIWGERPPKAARSTLHSLVSRLRRILRDDDGILLKGSSGYLLQLGSGEVDSIRFRDLAVQARDDIKLGRDTQAAVRLCEALNLWQGDPFAGVTGTPRVAQAADQLEQERLSLIEEFVLRRMPEYYHSQLLVHLRALVVKHPLRERLWEQLIYSLYETGRRSEAFDAYQAARQTLLGELGADPGPRLTMIHQRMLEGKSLRVAAEEQREHVMLVPRQTPSVTPDFSGREEQVERMLAAVSGSSSRSTAAIVTISGMAGVGKTTLAVHVAHLLRDRFPDGVLYANLHGFGSTPAEPGVIMSRFLRALGMPGSAISGDIDERIDSYRSLLADSRMLILLDDVANEAQIEPLIAGGAACAVIITSRLRLAALTGTEHVTLDVLTSDQATEMLERALGADRVSSEPAAAGELSKHCGYLPLALRICAARLASRPHWTIAQFVDRLTSSDHRLRELRYGHLDITASLEISYTALSAQAQLLFRSLALLDAKEYTVWLAAALLDSSALDAEDLLEELVDARMLEIVSSRLSPRYRFHDLVRLYAVQLSRTLEPSAASSARVRALGAWLALAEAAHRDLFGTDFMLLHSDAPRWRPVPDELGALHRSPIEWFNEERSGLKAAIRQADRLDLVEHCWDLAATSATLYGARGYLDEWQETHEIALNATRRLGDRRGEAVILQLISTLQVFRRQHREALETIGSALRIFQDLDERRGYLFSLVGMGIVERRLGLGDSGLLHLEQALGPLYMLDEHVVAAHVQRNIGQILLDRIEPERAYLVLSQALAAMRVGKRSVPVEGQILYWLAQAQLALDDLDGAEKTLLRCLEAVEATGDVRNTAVALHSLGRLMRKCGRFRAARKYLVRSQAAADEAGERRIAAEASLNLRLLTISDDADP